MQTKPLYIASISRFLSVGIIFLLVAGCGTLRDLIGGIEKPDVTYSDMRFESLNFDGVTLRFNFDIENPNRVDLRALGYTYAFSVDENPFLRGSSEEGLELKSRSSSRVSVPVTLNFRELYDTVSALAREDSVAYGITSTFEFDIPVLGRRQVPVEASGFVPVPKRPRLNLERFAVQSLSLSGAEVNVILRFENPNSFGVQFSDIDYVLRINGERWASAGLDQTLRLSANDTQTVTIPLRLDIAQLGMSVYRMLMGNQSFEYNVTGGGKVSVDLPYFEDSRIPFDISGHYEF